MFKTYQLPSPSVCLAHISDANNTNKGNTFILNKKSCISSCDAIIDSKNTTENSNCVNTIVYYDSEKLSAFNKETSDQTNKTPDHLNHNLFRSVIITGSGDNARYVCFSPPHMERAEYDPLYFGPDPMLQEYVDGTMINVFYDIASDPPKWEISTRRVIGGRNSFTDVGGNLPVKTFRELFDECCVLLNFHLSSLDPTKCYSFVMQHPESRIVQSVRDPMLYLIGEYEFEIQDDLSVMVKSNNIYDTPTNEALNVTRVRVPRKLTPDYHSIVEYVSPSVSFNVKGVIEVGHGNHPSVKYRNPNYDKVQQIKGNQSKLQYHYLELCTSPQASTRIGEFIRYFPEYKPAFIEYSRSIKKLINCIYGTYLDCYINRKFHLKDADERYKTLVYVLHAEVYLAKLKPENNRINKMEVTKFVQDLPCAKLMYYLNRLKTEVEPKSNSENDIDSKFSFATCINENDPPTFVGTPPVVSPIVSPISRDIIEIDLSEEELKDELYINNDGTASV
jgi:hypothetical protein